MDGTKYVPLVSNEIKEIDVKEGIERNLHTSQMKDTEGSLVPQSDVYRPHHLTAYYYTNSYGHIKTRYLLVKFPLFIDEKGAGIQISRPEIIN